MADAIVALILHAHLPFVRHPEHEDFLEERWFQEAVTESYIPLLTTLDGLERDRVPCRLAVSLSPTLLNMLADPLLRARYLRYLDRLVELAEKEERRTRGVPAFHAVAELYVARLAEVRARLLDHWRQDLIAAFRHHRDQGRIELLTSAATHGILPLLSSSPGAVRAQVEIAAAQYRRFFGAPAAGFWLPECAYAPGLDEPIRRAGFRYVILDAHGLGHASPRPVHGVYAPIVSPSGLAAFGRDPDSAKQVWSLEEGYPGDPWYRDFHRDIGFDLDLAYVGPYVAPSGDRIHTGIKYHRITGRTDQKQPYDPDRARERTRAHAAHFVDCRRRQVEWLSRTMDRPPVITCPYDAELFGHWWFEGPQWIDAVLRELAHTPGLATGTPLDDLTRHPTLQVATPAASTWGWKGYSEVWLSAQNDWIYRHLHAAADRLHALCRRYPGAEERTRRALAQALRELLLAQSSDWAFMMSRHTTSDYAVRRTREHLRHCRRLCAEIEAGAIDDLHLAHLEDHDNVFPSLDHRVVL